MKVYTPQSELIRLRIMRIDEKDQHIVLEECNLDEVYNFVQDIFKNFKYITDDEPKVRIEIREYKNKKNGKARNISFHGLTTEEVEQLILKRLCTK
jgi:hypothetical protein